MEFTRSHPAHSSDVNAPIPVTQVVVNPPIPVTYIELSTEHRYIIQWIPSHSGTQHPIEDSRTRNGMHSRVAAIPTRMNPMESANGGIMESIASREEYR